MRRLALLTTPALAQFDAGKPAARPDFLGITQHLNKHLKNAVERFVHCDD